jgi:hypothetical protein
VKNIIQFMVTKEQGVYTADGVNVPVVTEGSTFEELQANIREAVALCDSSQSSGDGRWRGEGLGKPR